MRRAVLAAVFVGLTLSQADTFSQGNMPPKLATDITAAEIQAVLQAPTGGADRQIKVVDMGKYNVGVGILHRNPIKPGGPVTAINHEQVTEVYYIVSGSGTLLTGGTVKDVQALPLDGEIAKVIVGPSNSGVFVEPAQSRVVSAGDVIIVPPGVFHGVTDVPDHMDYISVRPDPGHILPAGYVNPVIKK